ncbi:MAG: hypothetical protein ACFFDN_32290 [Candidatus Hodarchaeota archaeon]
MDPIIDIGETKTIYLTVKTDHKFGSKAVLLKYTPSYAENPLDIGESKPISFIFINDGSYKEDESYKEGVGLEIDTMILIIIIVVIILILVLVIMLKRKKQ